MRARNAALGEDAGKLHRVIDAAKNRRLLLFAACLSLFQFRQCLDLAAGRREARCQQGGVRTDDDVRPDHRPTDRGRAARALGRLPRQMNHSRLRVRLAQR
jgi:hypothetical protein